MTNLALLCLNFSSLLAVSNFRVPSFQNICQFCKIGCIWFEIQLWIYTLFKFQKKFAFSNQRNELLNFVPVYLRYITFDGWYEVSPLEPGVVWFFRSCALCTFSLFVLSRQMFCLRNHQLINVKQLLQTCVLMWSIINVILQQQGYRCQQKTGFC